MHCVHCVSLACTLYPHRVPCALYHHRVPCTLYLYRVRCTFTAYIVPLPCTVYHITYNRNAGKPETGCVCRTATLRSRGFRRWSRSWKRRTPYRKKPTPNSGERRDSYKRQSLPGGICFFMFAFCGVCFAFFFVAVLFHIVKLRLIS